MFKRKQKLKNVTYHDISFFNFNGYNTWAKCVKLYDGDTGTFAFKFNKKIYKFRMRLAEIDTAEMRSKDKYEIEIAEKATNRLKELIGDKLVYIQCFNYDKYGRILCKIYDDNTLDKSYNDILVEEGLAYLYNGGQRLHYSDWYIKNK